MNLRTSYEICRLTNTAYLADISRRHDIPSSKNISKNRRKRHYMDENILSLKDVSFNIFN